MCPDTSCPQYRHGCTPSPRPSAASSTQWHTGSTEQHKVRSGSTISLWGHSCSHNMHLDAPNGTDPRPSQQKLCSLLALSYASRAWPQFMCPRPGPRPPALTDMSRFPTNMYQRVQHSLWPPTARSATHQRCLYAPRPPTDASQLLSTCPALPQCIPGRSTCPSLPDEKRHWENPLSFHVITLDSPSLPHHPPSNGTWT